MDITIDQQVALDKALVPHVSRLRIGKSNFLLRPDITSKESTLQLVYDVLRLTPFYKAFLVTADVPEIYIDDQMFTMIKLVSRHQNTQQFGVMLPIELTNNPIRNSKAYKEYYAVASRAAPPKTKTSVRKTKSSSDTTITPPGAASTRLSTSTKGKQPAKASKEESLIMLSEVAMTKAEQIKLATKRSLQHTHISQASGLGADEGTGILPGVPNVPTEESEEEISWKSRDDEGNDDDQDEGNDDDQDTDDEGNDDENLGLNVDSEEGQDAEDDEDELYRDVNINLEGRDSDRLRDEAQAENEEFLKNLDENIKKIIKEKVKEQVKVQVSMILLKIEKTMNEQLEVEVLTRSSNSSKTSYVVAADLLEMKHKKISIDKMESNKSIHRSNKQRNLYKALVEAYESDKIILGTYGDIVTLKRRHDDDADKDEEPSAGSDRGSKRQRERKEPESTSALKEKATRTTGKSTQGSKSQQKTTSESAPAEEPMQNTQDLEEPSHQEFETGAADDQPIAEASQHPECRKYTTSVTKTKAADYGHIKWIEDLVPCTMWSQEPITVRRDDEKLYKFKEGDFKKLRIQDIEDMLLLLVQGKVINLTVEEHFAFNVSLRMFTRSIVIQRRVEYLQLGVESCQKKLNLTKPDTYCFNLKRKEAYTAYSNPRGFIYQNKNKQNRLMRIDECTNSAMERSMMFELLWMIVSRPEPEGSTQGYLLVSVEVLRYDKRSKSKNIGIVPTEMELILEHTQQGISHEVLVSAEGVEE
nr:hypothetical protein [Tanacetum cinerariifolium]